MRISDGSSDVCASDLLLTTGKRRAAFMQAILDFVPQACASKRFFDDDVQIRLGPTKTVDTRPIGNILIDRLGKGIGLLERSEEHTSELQSLMRISYAVFCLKKQTNTHKIHTD